MKIFTSCSFSPSGALFGAVTPSVTGSWQRLVLSIFYLFLLQYYIFEKACSLEKICFYQKVNAGSYKALGVKISETKTVDVIWEYNYRNFYTSPYTAQPSYEDFAKTRSAELYEGNIEACRCRGILHCPRDESDAGKSYIAQGTY